MNLLPKWAMLNNFPAIHDFESLTVIEQTARVYGAMNTLINEYNKFADTVNDQLSLFTESEQNARKEFEHNITKVIREFMCDWNSKIADLNGIVETAINEALKNGQIAVAVEYDPSTETLNIIAGGEV